MKNGMRVKMWMAVMAVMAGMATSVSAFTLPGPYSDDSSAVWNNIMRGKEKRQREKNKKQRIEALSKVLLRKNVSHCAVGTPSWGIYESLSFSSKDGLVCRYSGIFPYDGVLWHLATKAIEGGDIAILSIPGGDDYLVYVPLVDGAKTMKDLESRGAVYSDQDLLDAVNIAAKRADEDRQRKAMAEKLENEKQAIEKFKQQLKDQEAPNFDFRDRF